MISAAVVTRYANAFVEVVLAPSSGIRPEQASRQLRDFDAAVKQSPELRNVLASPSVSTVRKRVVIKKIAEALGLASIVRNFLLVMSDHRRLTALSQTIDAFEVALDARLGFVPAEVRSAGELTAGQQRQLADELSKLAGAKVRLRFAVEPDLIGGVAARIGSTIYDGSVRAQLAALRERLASKHV